MSRSPERFAELLQEGITAVANRTSKPKSVIRDELGYAVGRKGGSAIEYWGYGDGHIPRKSSEVEALARALVDEGGLDRTWLSAFLESAGYAGSAAIVTELFPVASDPLRNNLPLPPTRFVGRDTELADLAHMIADPGCRLITLIGPGGSGKTRLATEAARQAISAFADGVVFVGLAPLSSPEGVAPAVATALHLTLDGNLTPQAQVLRYVRQQALLLVLDNFEHLLPSGNRPEPEQNDDPAIALVTGILDQAPDAKMLVTSRERLNIRGEWVYDVDGLETPTEEAAASMENSVDAYSAPTLFVQTARRVQAGFAPSDADTEAILRICRVVGGMPLAIELAAAWVRVLSCNEIAEEIEESLELLATTQRDLSPRHRSMQAVFDHSWHLLSVEEQSVFAGCSIFRGGFTREVAVKVTGASLPILAALADKSLLRRNHQERYEIHELARQYAADRLAEAHGEAQARQQHLCFFTQFAEEAEPWLTTGQNVLQTLDRIEREHDNLRAAIEWALNDGEFALGMRIVGALWYFWIYRGYAREGQAQAKRYLVRPEAAADNYRRAKVLHTAGVLAFYQGHFESAHALLVDSIACSRQLGTDGKSILTWALIAQGHTLISMEELDAVASTARECLRLGHELQDAYVQGHALLQIASVNRLRGKNACAEQHLLASIERFQTSGDIGMHGAALVNYGRFLSEQGDYTTARDQVTRGLAVFEDAGDIVRHSYALRNLGVIAVAQGDYAEAQALLTKALKPIRRTGNLRHLIEIVDNMGRLAQLQGNYAGARTLLQESLSLSLEIEHTPWIARALEALGCLAASMGQFEDATHLFGAADAHAVAIETRLDPVWRANHEHWVGVVRTQLDEAAFSAAWAEGAATTLEQAIDYTTGSE